MKRNYVILTTDNMTPARNQIEARDFVKATHRGGNLIILTEIEFRDAVKRTARYLGYNEYGYKSLR